MNKLIAISLLLISLSYINMSCEPEKFAQGKRIYEVNCGNCHMSDGKGLGEMYPDITQSQYFSINKAQLPCLIRNGKKGSVMTTVQMPPNKEITEVGMNNLINYINHTWGDKSISNLYEIKEQLENCSDQ